MTSGHSKTVEAFLKGIRVIFNGKFKFLSGSLLGAARKRKFQVIVAESSPSYQVIILAMPIDHTFLGTEISS